MSLALQLIAAIRLKDNGKVYELLERMDVSDVNRKEKGDTALHVACRGPNEVLDLLLSKTGIDVNVKNGSSFTPLHVACRLNNHYAVQKILTSAQVDVNAKTLSGRTPLHLACINNYHTSVFQLLASPGIQVNEKDDLGITPIMYSAGHCHKEALKLMLEDPRVDLDEGGGRLEVQVRRFGGTEKEKCLEMINNERKKRENRQVKQEQPSQAGNIGIDYIAAADERAGRLHKSSDERKQKPGETRWSYQHHQAGSQHHQPGTQHHQTSVRRSQSSPGVNQDPRLSVNNNAVQGVVRTAANNLNNIKNVIQSRKQSNGVSRNFQQSEERRRSVTTIKSRTSSTGSSGGSSGSRQHYNIQSIYAPNAAKNKKSAERKAY